MRQSVFVNSVTHENGKTVVEASNGGEEGPPFVRFELTPDMNRNFYIGKRYDIEINEVYDGS